MARHGRTPKPGSCPAEDVRALGEKWHSMAGRGYRSGDRPETVLRHRRQELQGGATRTLLTPLPLAHQTLRHVEKAREHDALPQLRPAVPVREPGVAWIRLTVGTPGRTLTPRADRSGPLMASAGRLAFRSPETT